MVWAGMRRFGGYVGEVVFGRGVRSGSGIGAVSGILFEGAADEVAGAEADGEREGEDDASEEDSKARSTMVPPISRWSRTMAAVRTRTSHLTPSESRRAYWSCRLTAPMRTERERKRAMMVPASRRSTAPTECVR